MTNSYTQSQGTIFVITGPSGAGKTTIAQSITQNFPQIKRLVTYTTRKPRTGEIHGEHYFFVSEEDFTQKQRSGFFFEVSKYSDSWYGSPAYLFTHLQKGTHYVVPTDVSGAVKLANQHEKTTVIWLECESKELERRLRNRPGSHSEQDIIRRLLLAEQERTLMQLSHLKSFVIHNDKGLEKSVAEVTRIITSRL